MKYISTRGQSPSVSFSEAILTGLSRDGGLLIPEKFPNFSSRLGELKELSYQDLAFEICKPFVEGDLDDQALKNIIDKSYATFNNDEVTPVKFIKDVAVLELFHGPTLAFKDVALQFLGNLFEELLKKNKATLNIIGATSGDTGSAAIHGVRGKEGISIFMLHPKGRVSPIQEKQMTTVLDENVHNIAIEGTFDDAQRIVKECFNDHEFRDQYHLGAVNSINWGRIMAQIVYYFYAAFRFQEKYPQKDLVFSVPTGNFGDVYAGYVATKMGLGTKQLIVGTNENDILARVLAYGSYKIADVHPTISPSMDIQISSNFERLLFDLLGRDGERVRGKMADLAEKGEFKLSKEELVEAQQLFKGVRIDTKGTLDCIRKINDQDDYVLDPHTAVGVAAAQRVSQEQVICLATAHPAKFQDAVVDAIGKLPEIPASLDGIMEKESRCLVAAAQLADIQQIMKDQLVD